MGIVYHTSAKEMFSFTWEGFEPVLSVYRRFNRFLNKKKGGREESKVSMCQGERQLP